MGKKGGGEGHAGTGTHQVDELREPEFHPDGNFVGVVLDGPDESVVRAEQVIVQALGVRIRQARGRQHGHRQPRQHPARGGAGRQGVGTAGGGRGSSGHGRVTWVARRRTLYQRHYGSTRMVMFTTTLGRSWVPAATALVHVSGRHAKKRAGG